MNGWTDAPLSARGLLEAGLLLRRLSVEARTTAVYTSPSQRARAIADGLEELGFPRATIEPDLREIGCGAVDGWDVERVRGAHPMLWRRNELQEDDDFRWPGGESCREFRARCLAAVDRICRAHPGERAIVVTHAGAVSQILGRIAGTPAARWSTFRPGNASITTVAWSAQGGEVVGFDDRAHLLEGFARAG